MKCRRWLRLANRRAIVGALSTLGLVTARAAAAQGQCPIPAPVALVEAQAIYSDRSGSQIDTAGLRRNQELIQPLRSFTDSLTHEVDGAGQEGLRCAATMLKSWAAAGAMLQQPASFPAMRERQRWALGITLAALKLRAQGVALDPDVVNWLHALNTAVVQDFARRHLIDNLEIWSGVNAASLALLDGDRSARQYESDIWQGGLQQIGADGYLPSELRRQSRALLYHQYYASALLFLRRLRVALGQPPSAQDDASLHRLIERVEASLCDPSAMAAASGGERQEPPPADQFAVGLVFGEGLVDQRWMRCGARPAEMRDDTLGGQLDRTFELMSRLH
jgi:poly(beta-D-mannuronate) lyase